MRKILIAATLFAGAASSAVAHADTYTVEPFDLDGDGVTVNVTQDQLGGSMCPCVKIPYPADGLHNQQGVNNINTLMTNGTIRAGDTVMGFSLGSQVVSQYLAHHTATPGVGFLLIGDTLNRNQQLVAQGQGVPVNVANPVVLVANEYDGWSDAPDKTSSPGYWPAVVNAAEGAVILHNYEHTRLDDPANVVTHQGNITAVLVPTQTLPNNQQQRTEIDDAYSRPAPEPEQLAAAASEQVGNPFAPAANQPEPAANVG